MPQTAKVNRDRQMPSWSKGWLLLLGLSVVANIVMGLRMMRPGSTAWEADGSARAETDVQLERDQAALTGHDAAYAGPTNGAAFLWSEIEDGDYRQYIANLRAVGCPEQTIRDLIVADVSQPYAARASAIWRRTPDEYWQKSVSQEPTSEQRKELMALADEQASVLTELLGVPMDTQQLIDLLHLQVHGAEQHLLFLPEMRREAAMRALAAAGYERKLMELHSGSSYSGDAEERLFAEQLEILSGVLTPAELTEFRLRHAPKAQQLRAELLYFECTPAEFEQLLDAREHDRRGAMGNLMDRGPATEQVRELFGEAQAEEFEKVTDLYYQNARRAVDQAELPVAYADSAWQICRDTRGAADRLAQSRGLSVEERKIRLREMRAEAEGQLNALLGEKVARPLRRDLGTVLQVTEANLKP